MFKVCIKTGQEICGGVLDKDSIDLMANAFIKLNRKALGSINNMIRQNRIEKKTCGETLLNYSNRFYKRQFITRKAVNNDLLQKLEEILEAYFNDEKSAMQGIPTVQFLAENLNVSAGYLSDMLRSLTGQNAQQHIHSKLIEKAKKKISTTNLTISEIAYQLGFEHLSSFTKLFKTKTKVSPVEYRQSFN
jgi:AraC family transcriptional activator of pobA